MFAAFSVSDTGARYKALYPPCGILHVVAAIHRRFPDLPIKVYSQSHLGATEEEMVTLALREGQINGALIAVPTDMDYGRALKLVTLLKDAGVQNILLGGFPFTVPFTRKAYYSAVNRQVLVCDTDGEEAGVGFVEYCLSKRNVEEIPNIFMPNGRKITSIKVRTVKEVEYPTLPLEIWDPSAGWKDGKKIQTELMASKLICRPITAWDVIWTGSFCSFAAKLGKDPISGIDKNRCDYCASSSRQGIVGPNSFWKKIKSCLEFNQSIIMHKTAVKIRLTADDYGNLRRIIRGIGESTPSWVHPNSYALELYAWRIENEKHARELKTIGTVQVFIGADGKGYKPEINGPYIKSLRYLQKHNILIHTAFIPGKFGETWKSLEDWYQLAEYVAKNFSDSLSFLGGYLLWVVPGSWDWYRVISRYPEFAETDYYDLQEIRKKFWTDFTSLSKGFTIEEVEERLEEYVTKINALSPLPGKWTFGRPI